MAALDFPSSPSNGQQFTGPGGVIWVYDSTKTAWVSGTLTTGIYAPITNDNGRNLIHNSMFNVQQHPGPFTATGSYAADRWISGFFGGTYPTSIISLNDTDRAQIGDQEANFAWQGVATGTGGTSDSTFVEQRIENIRRTANKTITLSFWAKATSGTPKIGVNFAQVFGSGGSPTSPIWLVNGTAATLSTTWARYTMTFVIGSVAGLTFGTTAGTDAFYLRIYQSSGATNNAQAGGIGVQSYTLQLWGVQLEIGNVATSLEKRDPVYELQQCQRFFCTGSVNLSAYSSSGGFVTQMISLPVPMRGPIQVTPSLTPTNVSGPSMDTFPPYQVRALGPVTATGACSIVGTFTASSDL